MIRTRAMAPALALLLTFGCSCNDNNGDDGGGVDMDGSVGDMDGSAGMDGSPGMDGGGAGDDAQVELLDGAIRLPDGNIIPAGPIPCQGHIYQCGDTLDNDGDGLTDDRDPDCLGPCDTNEGGYDLDIPGGGSAPCQLDCYFDQDTGSGNDHCYWDHRCDPLEPELPRCPYSDPPPASADCPDPQDDRCGDICSPLVPNGCDCFGCCNLPAGGDRWVFIGAVDSSGNGTCTLDNVEDDAACPPCTPVGNCLNTCEECELCLGRTELPPECTPMYPDAGPMPDAGPLPDGAVPPDGGPPPPPVCSDGRQACGVDGLPPCPSGFFCLTGCCTFFG